MDTDFGLYIIGGRIRHGEGSISGAISIIELENFHINKAIISAGGITVGRGLSDYNIEEALVRKKVIDQSREVIVVADSSKFGQDVLSHICPLSDVDLIITDNKLDRDLLQEFKDVNIVFA